MNKNILQGIISQGENQRVEFKLKFPRNESLGKEIAAFATTNDGTIIIGVDDNAQIIGIPDGNDESKIKHLSQKIEGICSGTVKPGITTSFDFIQLEGKVILVISVPKGEEPVYYVQNKPYLRRHTESRPAEPNEVINFIKKHLNYEVSTDANEKSSFVANLVTVVNKISIIIDQSEQRNGNPWLENWKTDCHYLAEELNELSINDIAEEETLSEDLLTISESLESIYKLRMSSNSSPSISELVSELKVNLLVFKKKHINEIPLHTPSIESIMKSLQQTYKKFKIIHGKIDYLVENFNDEELKEKAFDIGEEILNVAYYNIDDFIYGNKNKLIEIGTILCLIETVRVYSDGGNSIRKIGKNMKVAFDDYQSIISSLDK